MITHYVRYDSQEHVTRTRYESQSSYTEEMKNHLNNYDLDNDVE